MHNSSTFNFTNFSNFSNNNNSNKHHHHHHHKQHSSVVSLYFNKYYCFYTNLLKQSFNQVQFYNLPMHKAVVTTFTPVVYRIAKLIGHVGDATNRLSSSNPKRCLPPITNEILLLPAIILAAKIRSRELSSEQVVRTFIDRIKTINSLLNAVVDQRFDDAIKDAVAVDKFLANTNLSEHELQIQKPLLGVPFTVKDSIQVDGMIWTSGCLRRKNVRATQDAPIVKNYKEAGAIPIALTNVPELLLWFASSNKLHGATNNPFDLTKVPGGSSGGEAALMAACGSPLSICSDIGGSIRMPAFHCGLFGHKPTHKVVDCRGTFPPIIDGLEEMFSFGPITRHADDLLPCLRIMAGQNIHLLNKIDEPVDLSSIKVYYLDETGIEIATNVAPYIKDAIQRAATHLASKFNIPIERPNLKYFKHISLWYMVLFSNNHEVSKLITEYTGSINPFFELAKSLFGKSEYSPSALAVAAAQSTTKVAFGKESSPEIYEKVEQTLRDAKQEFNSLLGDNGVFIYITLPRTALGHYATAFEFGNVCCPMVMNYLNAPTSQVPVGLHEGLPFGIQIAASTYNDRLTIAVAKELEGLFGGWINPSNIDLT